MKHTFTPELLTDKSRLQEIYDLRVTAWENSAKKEFVNKTIFPNGWYDNLDDNAFHWIIENENKIVASARVNLFDNHSEIPYYKYLSHLSFPEQMPMAFFSRLVINPSYQGNGISYLLDKIRIEFCLNKNVHWLQVLATNERFKSLVEKFQFEIIGQAEVNYHEYTKPHIVNVFIKKLVYA